MANRPENSFNQEVSMLIDTATVVLQFPREPHIGLFRVKIASPVRGGVTGDATLTRWPHLRQLSVVENLVEVSGSQVRVNLSSDPLSGPDQAVAYFLRKNYPSQPDLDVDGPAAIPQVREYLESLRRARLIGTLVFTRYKPLEQ